MNAAACAPSMRDELDDDFERRLVSCLLLDMSEFEAVSAILKPSEFSSSRARHLFETLGRIGASVRNLEDHVDVLLVARYLEERGELALVGGPAGLGDFVGLEAVAVNARRYAIEVKKAAVRREIRLLLREIDRFNDDSNAFELLTERFRELRDLQSGAEAESLAAVGLSADHLIALCDRADPVSPLAGFLDPEPSLHVVHGVAKVGKTTFLWNLALAILTGTAPWPGAEALPQGRVLVLSAEQGARKCTRVLRRLASTAGYGPIEDWVDQLTIVGRHGRMTDLERRLLVLDGAGIALLRRVLEKARSDGKPYFMVVIDSLSRVKPPGARIDESNDDALAILKPLADLAVEMGVYITLIHHSGHSSDRRGKAVDGVRGASAIRDVPQVLIVLDKHEDPRCRVVRVAGNELPDLTAVFRVARAHETEGFINRFERDEHRALDLEMVFEEGPLGLIEFGRRALGWAPNWAPSGGAKEAAKARLESLVNQGVIRREGAGWDIVKK